MFSKQRGATLLEAILAAAIMGWVLAYVGTQLKVYALNQQINKSARKLIHVNNEVKSYITEFHLPADTPDASENNYVVNPLLSQKSLGGYWHSGSLYWMKSIACRDQNGILPTNIKRTYFSCNFESSSFSLDLISIYIVFDSYNSLSFPKIHRYTKNAWAVYANTSNKEIGDFFSILNKISNLENNDGVVIDEDKIIVFEAKVNRVDVEQNLTMIKGTDHPLSYYTGGNIDAMQDFIKSTTSGRNYAAAYIPIITNNLPNQIFLKADGTISIDIDASLCWDSVTGEKKPCIRAITNREKKANYLIAESGFAFGTDKKRTPLQASYHTFENNNSVTVSFLECPNKTGDLIMKNKMAAINSSFSSGSENNTSFVNPSQIISKGTKGANGKHAFISGLSLEWKSKADKYWEIEGAVAIDAAYQAENKGSSVLRNPKSMSFIVIQWCEEEGA